MLATTQTLESRMKDAKTKLPYVCIDKGYRVHMTNRDTQFKLRNANSIRALYKDEMLVEIGDVTIPFPIDWASGAEFNRFDLNQFAKYVGKDPVQTISPLHNASVRFGRLELGELFNGSKDITGTGNSLSGYWVGTTRSKKKYVIHFTPRGGVSMFTPYDNSDKTPKYVPEVEDKPEEEKHEEPAAAKEEAVTTRVVKITQVTPRKRGRPSKAYRRQE